MSRKGRSSNRRGRPSARIRRLQILLFTIFSDHRYLGDMASPRNRSSQIVETIIILLFSFLERDRSGEHVIIIVIVHHYYRLRLKRDYKIYNMRTLIPRRYDNIIIICDVIIVRPDILLLLFSISRRRCRKAAKINNSPKRVFIARSKLIIYGLRKLKISAVPRQLVPYLSTLY